MIKEVDFLALKNELIDATVKFERVADTYKFYFNEHDNLQYYKTHLIELHYKFCKELRENIVLFKTNNEITTHLEMLIGMFELFKDQIDERSDYEKFHRNNNLICNDNMGSCINCSDEELSELRDLFMYQKRIINKSIKQIQSWQNRYALSNRSNDKSWMSGMKDFYPVFMRMKGELSLIMSISDKIKHIHKVREQLVAENLAAGNDFYNSPLNFYFEACLDCLSGIVSSCRQLDEKPKLQLKWTGSKIDFVELVLSLDLSKNIVYDDERPITRINLLRQFESFLGINPINDITSRIDKLKNRSNRTQFLDQLKKNCDHFLKDSE